MIDVNDIYPHQGQANFKVSGNGVKTAIRVVASDNIGDNMLISYQDLLKFQVIPINFLYNVLAYTVSADVMESIKHDFSDVLNDWLNPIPMKRDKPMLINLKENAKPLKVQEGCPRDMRNQQKQRLRI